MGGGFSVKDVWKKILIALNPYSKHQLYVSLIPLNVLRGSNISVPSVSGGPVGLAPPVSLSFLLVTGLSAGSVSLVYSQAHSKLVNKY